MATNKQDKVMNDPDDEVLYFSFPVAMMEGVLDNPEKRKNFLHDLLQHHIYWHSEKMKTAGFEHEETDLERFKRSAQHWEVSYPNGTKNALQEAEILFEKNKINKVFTGIAAKVYWDFHKNQKSEFEWKTLFAVLAIRSMIGKSSHIKTNDELLKARMSGKVSSKIKGKKIQLTRHTRDKILRKELLKWGIIYYSAMGIRGFYVGKANKISVDELRQISMGIPIKRDQLTLEKNDFHF